MNIEQTFSISFEKDNKKETILVSTSEEKWLEEDWRIIEDYYRSSMPIGDVS